MIEKYDPENQHSLVVCLCCGSVSNEDSIKTYTRDENDCKIAYLKCPICDHKVYVDYD